MGERQRFARTDEMATTSTAVATVSPQTQEEPERSTVITLRPTRTEEQVRKKVVWTEDTVDNEHMNKKKSKCCCIYHKPSKFGDSDSEDSDDECEHCFGHVEVKKTKGGGTTDTQGGSSNSTTVQLEAQPHEPAAAINLHPEPAPTPPDKPDNIPEPKK